MAGEGVVSNKPAPNAPLRWAGVLAVIGILERAGLWLVYQPGYYGDTGAYQRLAEVLRGLTLVGYDGTRVPGYPAFLALVGPDGDSIWFGQMVLGLGISLLLFWITWRTTSRPALGALVGMLYNLIPGQILFEANLLTETLTTFFVVASFALLLALRRATGGPAKAGLAALLGIVSALAGLTRVLFYVLPVWLLPFVWWAAGSGATGLLAEWRPRLLRTAVYCVAPILLLGGWLTYIQSTYHMLSPTVMTGFNWVQHTGSFFEYLPDEDALIRDTYIRYRDRSIQERGDQTNTIWDAIPELTEVTGLSFFDLSRELQRLSLRLIRDHPGLYLRNVVEGWIAFWKAPPYWRPESFRLPWMVPAMRAWVIAGRGVSILANALFLLMSVASAVSRRARQRIGWDTFAWAVAGLIWLTSFVQTLVDHGDNPRFLVPLQMLVIYLVARLLASLPRRPQAPV
jgi:hypothetical protein